MASDHITQQDQANDLAALSVRRPYLAIVINLLIIIAGLGALFGVEVRELPDIDQPIVTVRANYPGGAPETIDAEVTSVLEAAVARVNGVKAVRSSSEENNLRIRAEFNPNVELIDAANDIREAVSRVQYNLPEGVEDIFVIKADADASPIMQIAVASNSLSIDELTRRIEIEIIPSLTSINGVADISMFGEREKVLRISLNPLKLSGYGLTVTDVITVLKTARFDVPAGSFKSGDQEVIVRTNASTMNSQEVENLILRDPVRLGDVATASFGPQEVKNYTRLDGQTVINLGIIRQAESNTISIASGIKETIEQLKNKNRDISFTIITNDARFIKGAIREVFNSLLFATLIVVIVIALFIGNWRAALIPAVTIPIALIGSIAAIWLMGFSLNLVTLLALVLATGLVVDDAIVVLENIQRHSAKGLARKAAAVVGTRQVFFAVMATTATLISVFLPISFLPSTAGRLFAEFGFVLAVTVVISSFVALSICPMIASTLPKAGQKQNRLTRELSGFGRTLIRQYEKLLTIALAAPLAIIGLCCLLAVGAAITYQSIGEELVPEEDRGQIRIMLVGPDGTGINYADRQVQEVENILKPYKQRGIISHIFTISGRWDPNRGWIEAPLVPWSERDISENQILNEIKTPLSNIIGSQARARRSNSLGLRSAEGGLKFALTGKDYARIAVNAENFVRAMQEELPKLSNFRVEFRATQPQLSIDIDRRRAADMGVSLEDLATTLKSLVDNDKITELTLNDQIIPVILEARPGDVSSPEDLTNLYIRSKTDTMVPLSQLVSFREFAVAAELDRHGQRRAIEISADPAEGYSLREAIGDVSALGDKVLEKGISILLLDEAAALNETSSGTTVTFLIALVIVFLVLTAQFESAVSAGIIILTVPFGLCGAIYALAFTGTTINIYSQIGILMLIGIMAKNSILMVEFADQLREKGAEVYQAAHQASIVRLRPIIMTMLSTILAGLPLILSSGPGSESRGAIGWVVFGGLGLSGLMTLFLTPALYVLLAGFSSARSKRSEDLARQMASARQKESEGQTSV